MRLHRHLLAPFALTLLTGPAAAQGTEIGFVEDFALALDREAVLEQLIPGTPEAYYYRCLHLQHTARYEEVEELLATWIRRHGRGGRVREVEQRQALLTYPADPARSLELLRDRLDLRFDHQRSVPGEVPDLPTRLDESLLDWAALRDAALRQHRHTIDGFRPAAYERLLTSNLSERQLQDLLGSLGRPDGARLVQRVVQNLKTERSEGFGSLRIHGQLLLDQLDAVADQHPAVLNDEDFVVAYLQRLRPGDDSDPRWDRAARRAYLERLQAFTDRLAPTWNSLKAHVLYHRLLLDLEEGSPDPRRFEAYLRLPRPSGHVSRDFLRKLPRGQSVADLNASFATTFDPVRGDDAVVREHLEHFFAAGASYESYTEWLDQDWLERVFAETQILRGAGDMERWYSLIDDPGYYERLKERVEIDFPRTQPDVFAADAPVTIDVDLKNVDTLIVKVFEVDALNYYREVGRLVDASIHLDGLVANEETTHTYDEPALRRVRRTFSFPTLSRPGVYVVEFIGNGLSSRAVVRKGSLSYTERVGAAGHVFQVVTETGKPVWDATLRIGNQLYEPDETRAIVVPFTSDPGTKSIVLEGDGRVALDRFEHQAETYQLSAGIHVDRETLLAGGTAPILIRPVLRVNGYEASLKLLEDPYLLISSTSNQGILTTQTVRDLELVGDAEFVHSISVPAGLARLDVELRGRVRQLSLGEDVDLRAAAESFEVNGIQRTSHVASPMLGVTPDGYVIDLLGRNGEPVADQALSLSLTHRLVRQPIRATLKTDAGGRVYLGKLPDISGLSIEGLGGGRGYWSLERDRRSYPSRLNGIAGRTLWVPLPRGVQRLTREVASLVELRRGENTTDRFDNLKVQGGYLGLVDLPAGDYELFLKRERRAIQIELTDGVEAAGWGIGAHRMLELDASAPMHLVGMAVDGDQLVVRLANAGDDTRVHLSADRYLPTFDAFRRLQAGSEPTPRGAEVLLADSSYHAGRNIGDEYRYILDRRYAIKYPGNMLQRPGLLLNPWAIEETDFAIGLGGGAGGKFGKRGGGRSSMRAAGAAAPDAEAVISPGSFASLEYLPDGAVVLSNLRPGEDGLVRVPLAELGAGHVVTAIAVDGDQTVTRTLSLAEASWRPRDQRLMAGLDPAQHLASQREIVFVDAGGQVVIDDVGFSSAETYDSLGAVFSLYQTLSGEGDLERFEPLTRWPSLDREARLAFYDEHACHEVHVFLHEKDPEFFDLIVRPYLANKASKTFLDEWLLGRDLTPYLRPWDFGQLNLVERILLTQRVAGESAQGARHVRELWELLPPDVVERTRTFATVMAGRAMDGKPGLSQRLKDKNAELRDASREELQLLERRAAPGAPAAARSGSDDFFLGAPSEEAEDALEEMEVEGLGGGGGGRGRLAFDQDEDLGRRSQARALWRDVDPTRAYAEHDYWHRTIQATRPDMIGVNSFWNDLAAADPARPFRSPHFAQCADSVAEMLLALSFLDLPFEAAEHDIQFEGSSLTLTAGGPLLLAREDLRAALQAEDEAMLLIGQNFFRVGDRYRQVGGQRRDKFVSDEFLAGVPYGCEVVLTNPTSTPRELELLMQVPEGAIPLAGTLETIGRPVLLDAYATQKVEFVFYFPNPGAFAHYPAHVSRDGHQVGNAVAATLNVVEEPSVVDTTSWPYLSQQGTNDEVLTYLDAANLARTDLGAIAWRMKDRAFFGSVVQRLRARHHYHDTTWSYGVYHRDPSAMAEYLRHQDAFLSTCGSALESPLVSIDPVERKRYQHLDFDPLVHARAHRFGDRREILDTDLAQQYLSLLDVLAHRPALDAADWMSVTYYLMLQDRIEEAFAAFGRVDPAQLETQLQYDAMRAYMAFFTDAPESARAIAAQYVDHPIPRWRQRFLEVLSHLDEARGGGVTIVDPEDLTQNQTDLAASEPALDLEVDGGQIRLEHQNLETVELRYYEMDIEFLFSTSPFVQQGTSAFAYIKPNQTQLVTLDPDTTAHTLPIPAAFASSNLMVEVRGAGLTKRQAHYANVLDVQTIENYGQLKVTDADSGAPLSKVYVKVYARLDDGEVRFHKDGYTDLRGRFDYVSLSSTDGRGVQRFSVLVLSDEDGAVIREVAPPLQ